jgi:hypothetical protein
VYRKKSLACLVSERVSMRAPRPPQATGMTAATAETAKSPSRHISGLPPVCSTATTAAAIGRGTGPPVARALIRLFECVAVAVGAGVAALRFRCRSRRLPVEATTLSFFYLFFDSSDSSDSSDKSREAAVAK